jgi:uncharacterized membrane protein SpoIIM required for sporulation
MEFKTKSERFVLTKKDQWRRLHDILIKLNRHGFGTLRDEEIQAFPRLFRLTCADLAEAKMQHLSPDVLDYLNQLVGQAHKFLYSIPPLKKSQVNWFFTEQLPSIIFKNWVYFLLAAVLFFSSLLISYTIIRQNPAQAVRIVSQSILEEMEASYRRSIAEERSLSTKNFMVTFYIQNNVSIAFACFALGVLCGVGTIYILIYNGVFIGGITGYIIGRGYSKNFFTFTTAHSIAEFTGLILAGAAGLALGFAIIKATRYYRKEWLSLQRSNIFTLVAASAFLLFLAAMIEGIISPSLLPYPVKAGVAIFTLILISGYFILWPGLRMIQRRNERQLNEAPPGQESTNESL